MARVRKGVIEVRNILARLQKDLVDCEALFDELYKSSSLSGPPSAIASVPDPLLLAKQQKFMYMTVALICSYWEGASSKIRNVPGIGTRTFNHIYKSPHNGRYCPWYKKDIQIMGNIRNCIAHHNGRIVSYKRYVRTYVRAPFRRVKSVPRKYYYDPSNRDPEIQLKPDDIKEFFKNANRAVPRMLGDLARLFP